MNLKFMASYLEGVGNTRHIKSHHILFKLFEFGLLYFYASGFFAFKGATSCWVNCICCQKKY
jgi:hypothetical protein